MVYWDLVKRVRALPFFSEDIVAPQKKVKDQVLRNQLRSWVRQGRVIRLRKGLYTLPNDLRIIVLSPLIISNSLYSPSYVSLEYALSSWGLIPERVHEVTAVTVRKTKSFVNTYGRFSYRHIKRSGFCGYEKIHEEAGFFVFIASPEKALIDKIYFDANVSYEDDYFLENLRLQNFEELKVKKLQDFSRRLNSKKVSQMTQILIRLIQKENEK